MKVIHPNGNPHVGGAVSNCTANLAVPCPLALTPEDRAAKLLEYILGLDAPHGIVQALSSKAENAIRKLDDGDSKKACGSLKALINQSRALSGKKIVVADADWIIAEAEALRDALGCR